MRFASAANLKLGEILGGVSSAPSTSTIFFHTREETSIKLILFPIIWHFSIKNFVLSLTKILQKEKLRWEVKIPGGNRRILNSVEGQGRALYREILHPLHIYTGIFDSPTVNVTFICTLIFDTSTENIICFPSLYGGIIQPL